MKQKNNGICPSEIEVCVFKNGTDMSFNLNSSEEIRHKNEEVQDGRTVLFHKSQGVLFDDFRCLKVDSLLIIMHLGQLEVLESTQKTVLASAPRDTWVENSRF
nr:unnamed protein product [Callosobruchus analis]